jgi:Glycosyltransferase sugar-binding region containing DXD motif
MSTMPATSRIPAAIPERYHFVWTGRRFPYFARLAIESVRVVEPRAEIALHVFGDAPAAEALAPVVRAGVMISRFDPVAGFDGLGVDPVALRGLFARIPAAAASAHSNLVRYAVLARHGGVYLDCDVLLLRSLRDLRAHDAFVGEERVLAIDAAWQAGERAMWMIPAAAAWLAGRSTARLASALRSGALARLAARLEPHWQASAINNAVIGARPGARFVRRLLDGALAANARVRYALGPTLITDVVRRDPSDVAVLPPSAFYAIPPSYSFQLFSGGDRALPADARLLHAVSSNHRALLASLDERVVRSRADRGIYYRAAAQVAAEAGLR